MPEPVVIAVPPKGGSLDDVLKKLVALGWLRHELVTEIRRLIREDKRRIKLEEGLGSLWRRNGCDASETMRAADEAGHDLDDVDQALRRMRRYQDEAGRTQLGFSPKAAIDDLLTRLRNDADPLVREAARCLHLELDLGRSGRPSRMCFGHLEFVWQTAPGQAPIVGVLIGTEHAVTPSYLRKHKRDLSLTCYDAFHNTLLDALDTGKVRNWRELMAHLIGANTDVRILGSLGLDDYLGHFVLMPEDQAKRSIGLGGGRRWAIEDGDPKLGALCGGPVLIDAQYEDVYSLLLESKRNGIRFEAVTTDIEKACLHEQRCAIYIVRSGSTIASLHGLCVVGEELITSETIVAVNQERLDHNRGVGVLVDSLAPSPDDHSAAWRLRLADKLGEKLL